MKIFRSTQRTFGIVGIDQSFSFKNLYKNIKCLRIIFGTSLGVALPTIFLLFCAQNVRDYAECFYAFATSTVIITILFQLLSRISRLFGLITDFEMAIEKSLWIFLQKFIRCTINICLFFNSIGSKNSSAEAVYQESNEKIEKLTETISSAYEKFTPICIFIPYVSVSYIQYFTSDLGRKAFRLPFTLWWVQQIL